jgi:hypothetical protein
MIVHELKAWPTYFRPTWDGEKLFDVRFDDRGFQRGDLVSLREWDNDAHCKCPRGTHTSKCERYTGRRIVTEIGYVLGQTPGRGSRPGFAGAGYVVLSLMNLDRVDVDVYMDAPAESPVVAWAPGLPKPLAAGGYVPSQRPPT